MLQLSYSILVAKNIASKADFETINNTQELQINLTQDIDCNNQIIQSVSFHGSFEGNNNTIQNCIVNQWTEATDDQGKTIKVMGLFSSCYNTTIKHLILKNIKFNLGYTNTQLWAGLSQPHFVGQVTGYGKNMVYDNITINVVNNDAHQNNPDLVLPIDNSFRAFLTSDGDIAQTSWCYVQNSNLLNQQSYNMFTGILGGYQEGSLSRTNIYAFVTYDFTFYDSSINGEYCRYRDSQTSQDSSIMFGAQISQ